MNDKEFINELSYRSGYTAKEAEQLADSFVNSMVQALLEGKTVVWDGVGSFDIEKKMEYISVDPSTGKRFLVPPELSLRFKSERVSEENTKSYNTNE